jgi:condensin complex subunit 2
LDLKKFDLEFVVDPLFRKTSADFDEGGARGLLLNHLSISPMGQIIFDADDSTTLCDSNSDNSASENTVDMEKLLSK